MKRLKLGFWLVAWSCWLWLGFGLHRELPKQPGPFVRRLWEGKGFTPIGFVSETNDLVVMNWMKDDFPPLDGRIVDAETGECRSEMSLPDFTSGIAIDDVPRTHPTTLKFGVLLGGKPTGVVAGLVRYEGLHALDLRSGQWLELSQQSQAKRVLHPNRPWIAVTESSKSNRVRVVDYRTGRAIFTRELPIGSRLFNHLAFIPGRDALMLPLQAKLGSEVSSHFFEVWNLAEPATLEHVVKDVGDFRSKAAWSSNGRMRFEGTLRMENGVYKHFDVYDFNEKSFLTSSPPSEQPAANGGKFTYKVSAEFMPAISPSGKSVLRFGRTTGELDASGSEVTPITLYEVGTGRVLWRVGLLESVVVSHGEDGFLAVENWHELWQKWLPDFKFETVACRSLEDGSLIHRTTAASMVDPLTNNLNRSLLVLENGAVHRLPLAVNYPLLALCQAILALPLVMLWAVLRWLRRQRARLASA
jgi:hypothetical protein